MELSTKAYGRKIFITVGENCIMQVAICMRVNSLTIWLKGSVFTSTPTAASTLGTGTRTNSMASEKKSGMIIHNIKAFTKMLPKKDKVNIAGLMETDM